MILGGLLIYGALTGSPTLLPQTIVPHVGTLPTVTMANGTVVNIVTGGSDPYNCGAVGSFCDPTLGLVCRSGQCVCSITGTTFCPQYGCINLQSFNVACGSCTNSGCGPNEACCSGGCINIATPQNCGACSRSCTGVSPGCCGGQCTDFNSDPNNCGTCFNAIPSTGFRCCSGAATPVNDQNCTSCGVGCPAGFVCDVANRTCVSGCPTGFTMCGGVCKNLLTDNFNCQFCKCLGFFLCCCSALPLLLLLIF